VDEGVDAEVECVAGTARGVEEFADEVLALQHEPERSVSLVAISDSCENVLFSISSWQCLFEWQI